MTQTTAAAKEDQCWDMAGLARQDGDTKDAKLQTERAQWWRRRVADGGVYDNQFGELEYPT